jgi:hypothetical protein
VDRGIATGAVEAARAEHFPTNRLLGGLFLAFGIAAIALVSHDGSVPPFPPVALLLLAAALFANRGGRFLRDWSPIVLALLAYRITGQIAQRIDLPVHYAPQLDADRLLGLGSVPTIWLQEHLYSGGTGALETLSVLFYLSHYFAPFILGFFLWWRRSSAFSELMLCLLAVTALAELTFLLVPTAPPWLAADRGMLGTVHPILQQGLSDLHLSAAAAIKGDASAYNIVAAVPSLHVAWPVVGLIVLRQHRFSRAAQAAQAALVLGVVFAIVYMGEHYAVDALAGALYAVGACWLVRRVSRARQPEPSAFPASA